MRFVVSSMPYVESALVCTAICAGQTCVCSALRALVNSDHCELQSALLCCSMC